MEKPSINSCALTLLLHLRFAIQQYSPISICPKKHHCHHILSSWAKIRKKCHGPFGPWMPYFWGPAQSFKGPDFLISLMRVIMVSLSPQNLWALLARHVLILRAHKQFWGLLARGPALFEPLPIFTVSNGENYSSFTLNDAMGAVSIYFDQVYIYCFWPYYTVVWVHVIQKCSAHY